MGKNKKQGNVKKTNTVEKDIIKESDYEDYKNDNKKIIVVALILALLIGGFAYIRSLDNKPKEDEPVVEEPSDEEETPSVEENDGNDTEVNNNWTNYYPVQTPTVEEKEEEPVVDVWEDLSDIPTNLEAGSEYLLPEVVVVDDEGEDLTAIVTYKFKTNEEDSEYIPVTEFDLTKIGSYLVTYTLEYAGGKVETKDVEIAVTDTTEPVVNDISNGDHFKDDVVLDITEYSPYIVELNGEVYDEELPITEEGEYTLTVTEDIPDGKSITVEFIIDKTAPEITGVEDDKYYNSEEPIVIAVSDDIVIESVVLTKDLEEIEFESGVTEILEEGSYVITATDKAGNNTEYTFTIDRTAPELGVVYTPDNTELTDSSVTVVITADEEIIEVDGWTISSDKLSLSKEFTENVVEPLKVKDLAGNETEVEVVVDYIDYTITYAPTLTLENLVANKVKATITSLEELTILTEGWVSLEVGTDGLYKYEKIYDTNGIEVVNYENSDGAGTLKVNIEITLTPFVEYIEDSLTGNVTAYVTTEEEVLTENIPEGWTLFVPAEPVDPSEPVSYRYYKEYTESVEYELVEFVTETKHYVATIMIDMDAPVVEEPEVEYTYSEAEPAVKESVKITITADEEIEVVENPSDWELSLDNKSISQTIDKPTGEVPTEEQNGSVIIKDASGNETEVDYSYNWN